MARGRMTMRAWGLVLLLSLAAQDSVVRSAGATDAVTLENDNGMVVTLLPTGATVNELFIPDKDGTIADVALGFTVPDQEEYYKNGTNPQMGSVVGRVANRISDGQFTLDGVTYTLYKNNGNDTLHGGKIGFDKVTWDVVEATPTSVTFAYQSWDGEEGFPGNVNATATYTLTENNELHLDFRATTDKATPINLAGHTYFNLNGQASGSILDHILYLPNAEYYTPGYPDRNIPTGEIAPVNGTLYDFTTPHAIGDSIGPLEDTYYGGYDNNWVLFGLGPDAAEVVTNFKAADEPQWAATLIDPVSGRGMELWTTAPGLQVYTGNGLDGSLVGKGGAVYEKHAGIALESQLFPNSINTPNFPNSVLEPGQVYEHKVVYKFFNAE